MSEFRIFTTFTLVEAMVVAFLSVHLALVVVCSVFVQQSCFNCPHNACLSSRQEDVHLMESHLLVPSQRILRRRVVVPSPQDVAGNAYFEAFYIALLQALVHERLEKGYCCSHICKDRISFEKVEANRVALARQIIHFNFVVGLKEVHTTPFWAKVSWIELNFL